MITDEQVRVALNVLEEEATSAENQLVWMRSALEAAEISAWQPIESAPKDGTPVIGSELYRYLPYKPEGKRQMKAEGRWQRWNGYGWENSEAPGGWMPAARAMEGKDD